MGLGQDKCELPVLYVDQGFIVIRGFKGCQISALFSNPLAVATFINRDILVKIKYYYRFKQYLLTCS